MGFQSVLFVVTPDELENALIPFTLYIANAHVPVNYSFTPKSVFLNNYREMYGKLCRGEKIDHYKDYKLLKYFDITTDISTVRFGKNHFYNGDEFKSYIGSERGYAPYFSPFIFDVYTENNKIYVSTAGSWAVAYTDIMGVQLSFPKMTKNEARLYNEDGHGLYNIESEKDWDSYNDYMLFRNYIMKHTSAFRFSLNGIEKKTSIRISEAVKAVISNFDCVKKNNLVVL